MDKQSERDLEWLMLVMARLLDKIELLNVPRLDRSAHALKYAQGSYVYKPTMADRLFPRQDNIKPEDLAAMRAQAQGLLKGGRK